MPAAMWPARLVSRGPSAPAAVRAAGLVSGRSAVPATIVPAFPLAMSRRNSSWRSRMTISRRSGPRHPGPGPGPAPPRARSAPSGIFAPARRVPPTRPAPDQELGVEGGRRDRHVDHRSLVDQRRVDVVDDDEARLVRVESGLERAGVPVGAAPHLEVRLRRRGIPVRVRSLQVAIARSAQLHAHVGNRVRSVKRVARPVVAERRRITDEVILPVDLPVEPRVGRRVIVEVGNVDVAEPVPDLFRDRMSGHVLNGLRMCDARHAGEADQKSYQNQRSTHLRLLYGLKGSRRSYAIQAFGIRPRLKAHPTSSCCAEPLFARMREYGS